MALAQHRDVRMNARELDYITRTARAQGPEITRQRYGSEARLVWKLTFRNRGQTLMGGGTNGCQ